MHVFIIYMCVSILLLHEYIYIYIHNIICVYLVAYTQMEPGQPCTLLASVTIGKVNSSEMQVSS